MPPEAVAIWIVLMAITLALALRDLMREGIIWTWSELNKRLQRMLDRIERIDQ